MRDSYQPKSAGLYSALFLALLGCNGDKPQPDKIAPDPVKQEPIGQLEQRVAYAAEKIDLSTPVKSLVSFERSIRNNELDNALACVYRPELFEAGFSDEERRKKQEEVKYNLIEDWINSADHNNSIEKAFGSHEAYLRAIEESGEVLPDAKLRWEANSQWASKYNHPTARVKVTHNGKTGTVRADLIKIGEKWYMGSW